ncbi:LPS assembly lipoprotein LptE [Halarcobacter ebronensis]|uniref:Penicillin-binding protein activator LpoB n=1 Tax=Halarcobacter ebronensis TaxID=1462615 RepID=A0A4Q1ASD3_9BACT|nr:LPS assembly lipoprotein LptE [Halarcobacter ebronensis]QKF81071.1 lipooligosaccharide transport system, OM translocon component LptE [Halarcobacter ebronensis]RXK06378.1 hypothetical protein CRV07_06705 [Halarcobacter ebronensis]
MRLSHILFFFFAVILFQGCGYKPSVDYAKDQIGNKVFVNLIISLEDPRNAAIIKDSMNEIIIHRLGSNIVTNPNEADTILDLKLNSVSMGVVQYDNQGYEKVYKAVVNILVNLNKRGVKKSFSVRGDYNFSIDAGAEISDANRFNAIRQASSKALDEVVSKIAIYSFKKED